jgi:hypothetical protein
MANGFLSLNPISLDWVAGRHRPGPGCSGIPTAPTLRVPVDEGASRLIYTRIRGLQVERPFRRSCGRCSQLCRLPPMEHGSSSET